MTQTKVSFSLKDLRQTGRGLPNRYVIHGVEGIGKTSLATMFPSPVFIQSKGETGLDTLLTYGRVKDTQHFPECESFEQARGYVNLLRTEQHPLKTLVVDTMNGLEALLHAKVTAEKFGGDSGPNGFLAYGKGPRVALEEWTGLLADLDRLRVERGMTIVLISHTTVKAFRNPLGNDYDRYTAAVAPETWSVTHKWADLVLFLNYEVFVQGGDEKKKGKATGKARIMYTERDAAYDAKNRHGLPPEIDLGDSLESAWANFSSHFKAGRKVSNGTD